MAAKDKTSATTLPIEDAYSSSEETGKFPPRKVKRAVWAIVIGAALPCIPILVITAVLLYFVFHYRVDLSRGLSEFALSTNTTHLTTTAWLSNVRSQGGDSAYYVDYNPSTITTIASWTSRVLPYLSSSIMALVAFFAARHLVLKSKHATQHGSTVHSPAQMSLLVNMLNGSSFGPLRDAIIHRVIRREKLIAPLPAAFSALFCITMLGLIISIVDSWFGIATTPWTIQQLVPKTSNFSAFGRGISSHLCPKGPGDTYQSTYENPFNAWWPCDVLPINGHGPFFVNLYDSLAMLYGNSKQHKILNYTDDAGVEYLYLGSVDQDSRLDFKASTYGTSAQCIPMTQLCYSNFPAGSGYLFNCTPAFSGNLYQNFLNASATVDDALSLTIAGQNVGVAFAGNPELTVAGETVFMPSNEWQTGDSLELGQNFSKVYRNNPIYYGVWASEYPASNLGSTTNMFVGDTGISFDSSSTAGGRWMLNCSTTVWDIEYTWVNGSVQTFNRTPASHDMGGLLSGPPAFASSEAVIQGTINDAATTAAFSGNTSRAIASRFAREFSKTMIAFSIAAVEPKVNGMEQIREAPKIVARIPLIPFYLLLATKALYVVAVIALAIGAYCFTYPAETEVVKEQLSIKGLTAAHFSQSGVMEQNIREGVEDRPAGAHERLSKMVQVFS